MKGAGTSWAEPEVTPFDDWKQLVWSELVMVSREGEGPDGEGSFGHFQVWDFILRTSGS